MGGTTVFASALALPDRVQVGMHPMQVPHTWVLALGTQRAATLALMAHLTLPCSWRLKTCTFESSGNQITASFRGYKKSSEKVELGILGDVAFGGLHMSQKVVKPRILAV